MVIFETNQYMGAHGRAPRGYGIWMFECAGVKFSVGPANYGEAKKVAARFARETPADVGGVRRVVVLS